MNKEFKITDEIISLLEYYLVKPSCGLKNIYKNLIEYFERAQGYEKMPTERQIKELQKILLSNKLNTNDLKNEFTYLHYEDIRTLAIDFPFSLEFGKRDTIMICAMDSLPPNNFQNDLEKKTFKHGFHLV